VRLYDRTHDCPTNAAIILFGKDPRYYMPGAYVQFVRFAGNSIGGDVLNEKRFTGPLFQLLPELETFVDNAIITQRPVAASLFREKTIINYPNNALRELMMNACMHRDYQSNMPIRLYQFDDHIEIMNAGGLYGEARPENFPLVNDYRNPIIAEGMKEMQYVNMFNQGIRRVQGMLRENGNQDAIFDVSKITAFDVKVMASLEYVGNSKGTNGQQVTERQYTIIQSVLSNPTISYKTLAKKLGVTRQTIYTEFKKLQEMDILIGEGNTSSRVWTVKSIENV
jgi:ATP-dependent DNA helicase RecG